MSEASSVELFFIVGSPRSGTTLLQAICMSSEGVYVPPETHFLTRFPRARPLQDEQDWARALAEIEEVSAREELPLEGLYEHAGSTPRTQAGLLQLWLESCARSQEARWIGEASNVHTRDLLCLAELFPCAKIIHMIRDPRDVATSQKEAWGTSVTRAALRWRDEILVHQRARVTLNPTRYRALCYERLVSAPRSEIQALCAWFGWPFQEALLSPHQREKPGFATREVHKLRTLQPITASRVGRWREALSEEEVMRVELICGGLMDQLGYTRDTRGLRAFIQASPTLFTELKGVVVDYGAQLAQQSRQTLERRQAELERRQAELERRAEAQSGLGEGR